MLQRFAREASTLLMFVAMAVAARLVVGPGHPGLVFIAALAIPCIRLVWSVRNSEREQTPADEAARQTLAEPVWVGVLQRSFYWAMFALFFDLAVVGAERALDWREARNLFLVWLYMVPFLLIAGASGTWVARRMARYTLARLKSA